VWCVDGLVLGKGETHFGNELEGDHLLIVCVKSQPIIIIAWLLSSSLGRSFISYQVYSEEEADNVI
jgi:hypothetical protein